MLPRTTQQSHSAAPRREPQIEPWLAMLPPSCLSAPEEDRTNPRCDPEMRGDANNAIEATSELPAGAGCQEKQNLPAKGKVFLLDIPFYRTRRCADQRCACRVGRIGSQSQNPRVKISKSNPKVKIPTGLPVSGNWRSKSKSPLLPQRTRQKWGTRSAPGIGL